MFIIKRILHSCNKKSKIDIDLSKLYVLKSVIQLGKGRHREDSDTEDMRIV